MTNSRSLQAINLRFAACILLLSGCNVEEENIDHVEVRSPCETFASEVGDNRTPSIRHMLNEIEIEISFSPAPSDEIEKIVDAVRRSPTDLLLYPDKRMVRALRVDEGRLVVRANSEAEAKEILRLLCF